MTRVCLVLAGVATLACVRELPKNEDGAAPPTGFVWELSGSRRSASVSLWPRDPGTPERKKREVQTVSVGGRLDARVEGQDPSFLWRFSTPVRPAVFRVDVVARDPGRLQLFWSTLRCPTFNEACSASHVLESGQNVVSFLLDRMNPIRELRLDLPEAPGAELSFGSITFSAEPAIDSAWVGRDTTQVSIDGDGLTLLTAEPDPWLIVATPGLDASFAGSVELTLRGDSGPPQLFWDGPCGAFAEACSVVFEPGDAGATTHRAVFPPRKWSGPIRHLRLDPGPHAGLYFIERIALVPRPPPQGTLAPP